MRPFFFCLFFLTQGDICRKGLAVADVFYLDGVAAVEFVDDIHYVVGDIYGSAVDRYDYVTREQMIRRVKRGIERGYVNACNVAYYAGVGVERGVLLVDLTDSVGGLLVPDVIFKSDSDNADKRSACLDLRIYSLDASFFDYSLDQLKRSA